MLAYAAMAYTAVDEGKTMLAYTAMVYVGVDEEIDDDCIHAAMAYVGVPVMAYTDNACK